MYHGRSGALICVSDRSEEDGNLDQPQTKEHAMAPVVARPRMKMTAPLLRGGGLLHIVGSHRVHTMSDPDGAIHRLVELADGTRSVTDLLAVLRAQHPAMAEQDVVDAVQELESAGVFETAGYARHLLAGEHRRELSALLA